jgi:hypothetical protein
MSENDSENTAAESGRNFADTIMVNIGSRAVDAEAENYKEPFAELKSRHNKQTNQYRSQGYEKYGIFQGNILDLDIEEGKIAYNISQPFTQVVDGETRHYLAARVEFQRQPGAGSRLPSSETKFFYRKLSDSGNEVWVRDDSVNLKMEDGYEPFGNYPAEKGKLVGETAYEDPSIAIDDDGYILMSRVVAHEVERTITEYNLDNKAISEKIVIDSAFHQEIWGGSDLHNLQFVARGPDDQKGSRIVCLGDGKYGLFNRPRDVQDPKFGPGRICFVQFGINSIDSSSKSAEFADKLPQALSDSEVMIPGLCADAEWVGPNQAWALPGKTSADFRIGVIGHIAGWLNKKTGIREYCAISFVYDPANNTYSELNIIATKEDFPNVEARKDRKDLDNVVYPGGAELLDNGCMRLYLGISDNQAGSIDIPDPFAEYRMQKSSFAKVA